MDDFTDFIIPKGTKYDFEAVAGFNALKKHTKAMPFHQKM
jgi:hypothetical protein